MKRAIYGITGACLAHTTAPSPPERKLGGADSRQRKAKTLRGKDGCMVEILHQPV